MENKSNRKTGRRENHNPEEVVIHTDIIEIERNLVEKYLIKLKHKIQDHIKIVKKVGVFLILLVLLFFILLFVHGKIEKSHSNEFFSLLKQYDKTKIMPGGEKRNKLLNQVIQNSTQLCNSLWSSKYSPNGCLVAALTYLEKKDNKNYAKMLNEYVNLNNDKYLGSYILFYAAYAYEASFELEKAYKLYDKLQKMYKTIQKEDIGLYHKARVKYLQNNYKEAKKLFNLLKKEYPQSSYLKDAKNYLLLIKSQQKKK